MTLREAYRPLRPDLDAFLFSEIGDERRAMPLSMVSALTQLGLDPWQEAAHLSSLSKREAAEQLARLIIELPDRFSLLAEARQIAGVLVERLPKLGRAAPAPPQRTKRPWIPRCPIFSREARFYLFCTAVAAAALLSIVLHRGFW